MEMCPLYPGPIVKEVVRNHSPRVVRPEDDVVEQEKSARKPPYDGDFLERNALIGTIGLRRFLPEETEGSERRQYDSRLRGKASVQELVSFIRVQRVVRSGAQVRWDVCQRLS